jgi:hypothetical protein
MPSLRSDTSPQLPHYAHILIVSRPTPYLDTDFVFRYRFELREGTGSLSAAMAATTAHVSDQTTYDEARNGAAAYLQSRLSAKDHIADEDFEIPIIDLSPSFSASLVDRQSVAAQIRQACTTSGFFYVSNHRIPEAACDGILHQADRFMHKLPLNKKQALHLKNNKLGLGWEPSEYTSIAGDKEEKEVFNFAYESGLDPTGGDGKYKNLDGSTEKSNMWPSEQDLPNFYENVKEYYGAVSGCRSMV